MQAYILYGHKHGRNVGYTERWPHIAAADAAAADDDDALRISCTAAM